jgi:peptidyl-prolyl cis-trans isomerase B (cyclophilin B)
MNRQQEVAKATEDLDFNNKKYQLQLKTNHGEIHINLSPDVAPNHCRNIIGLARIGYYDGLIFHRIIEGFMIQGGCPQGTGTGNPGYSVAAEFNKTPHVAGVLSAARSASPDSAGSQFFICLDAHSHLDGQYTAYGMTTPDTMDVVEKIGAVETARGDRPLEDVSIETMTVVEI